MSSIYPPLGGVGNITAYPEARPLPIEVRHYVAEALPMSRFVGTIITPTGTLHIFIEMALGLRASDEALTRIRNRFATPRQASSIGGSTRVGVPVTTADLTLWQGAYQPPEIHVWSDTDGPPDTVKALLGALLLERSP